jgi:hypothetical protein
MGSGRSENAAGAPKQGAFPAGLIGAEPIDLAAVRQDKRGAGQVTGILKDLAVGFKAGQNDPFSPLPRAPGHSVAGPVDPGTAPYIPDVPTTLSPIGTGWPSQMTH